MSEQQDNAIGRASVDERQQQRQDLRLRVAQLGPGNAVLEAEDKVRCQLLGDRVEYRKKSHREQGFLRIVLALLLCQVFLTMDIGAQPTNDNFSDSVQLSGTNIVYSGNFDGAVMEAGEPFNGASNTVWMSWAAPSNGYVVVNMATTPQFQYYAIYSGSSVDQLQPVNLAAIGYNSIYRFMAFEGVVYRFQFSGGADNFTFNLQFQPFGPCTNDNFTNAQPIAGMSVNIAGTCINSATTEPGEP